tara:strand:- start:2273 stop:2710 length:438 start_codon:yes stop_codon:yes gene_type:complete
MPAKHDIVAYQGDNFILHVHYQDENGNSISVPSPTYSANMQVRRSTDASKILLNLTSNPYSSILGCTAGITGGGTARTSCTGGIVMNRSEGDTGDLNGGIYIFAGATAMGYVPTGRHLYDLEITATGGSIRLLQGRFECVGEITR